MKPMRKTLLGLMTFLMLTPVLACAMAFCPLQSAQAAEPQPCHQSSQDTKTDGPMLALDCMGVDLFQQDTQADVPQPENIIDAAPFAWTDTATEYSVRPSGAHLIRGPPGDIERPQAQPPILLTTQRFRI